MTAAARKANGAAPSPGKYTCPSPLAVFVARAEARALLWKCCEFSLHDAVDVLWHAAERDGLVDDFGADRLQQFLADTFAEVR
jgi:hypothetical protein